MSVKPGACRGRASRIPDFRRVATPRQDGGPYPVLKDAFLFSLTGMRWSDINVRRGPRCRSSTAARASYSGRKRPKGWNTSTSQAKPCATWVSAARQTSGFAGLKYSAWHNLALREWCLKAGITKHITFHCGRHTFAVSRTLTRYGNLHRVEAPRPPRTEKRRRSMRRLWMRRSAKR